LPVVAVWQLIVVFADSACVFSTTNHHDNRRGFSFGTAAVLSLQTLRLRSAGSAAATLVVTVVTLIIISISLAPINASLTVVARCCSS